jgi:hypothetical protein
MDRIREEIHPSLLAMFEGTEAIRLDPVVQGNRILENGVISFGASAALHIKNENLLHEMSHFVEVDQRRMAMHGWGLRCKTKVKVMGQYYNEPRTCQATLRECRVIAYQANLAELFDIPHDVVDFARALQWMSDTAFVPLEDGTRPYCEGASHGLDSVQIRESQHLWCVAQIAKFREELTAGKFLAEWYRRRDILDKRFKKRIKG